MKTGHLLMILGTVLIITIVIVMVVAKKKEPDMSMNAALLALLSKDDSKEEPKQTDPTGLDWFNSISGVFEDAGMFSWIRGLLNKNNTA